MPRGIIKTPPASEETQRLLDAMAEIEGRLAEMRRKDKARAGLLAYAHKHGLGASDLREVAKQVGAREVGDQPVLSKNAPASARLARGRQLRAAREAKGLSGAEVMRRVGVKGTAPIVQWEKGGRPSKPKVRAALSKLLDLPKDFWGAPKLNGAAGP